jgi:3-dehydroquinate dehydratase-1
MNYCLPIIETTLPAIQQIIETYQKDYDYFEIWLDYLESVDEQKLHELITTYGTKLIFLFRRQNLETPLMAKEQRQRLIKNIATTYAFIDLDISQKEELHALTEKTTNARLLCSYHNYQKTPDDKTLTEILETMQHYHPTIRKIATLCTTERDALRLLTLMMKLRKQKQQTDKKYIILGMGKFGTITRVAGMLWGNEINFAPITKTQTSALGQLTKTDLESITKILKI